MNYFCNECHNERDGQQYLNPVKGVKDITAQNGHWEKCYIFFYLFAAEMCKGKRERMPVLSVSFLH